MQEKLLIQICIACCFFAQLSCETVPPRRGSASIHPAAYSGDWMTYSKPQPERSENDFKFYYKHCSVDSREPFPKGAIWECTNP